MPNADQDSEVGIAQTDDQLDVAAAAQTTDDTAITLAGSSHVADADRRCGFVAIIGAPNAGKSTLVNALVGSKVTIVSRKVQTTRTTIRGIAMVGPSQLVLIDTPGIFAPQRRLDRAMVDAAWGGAADADIVGLMVDAQRGITEDVSRILDAMKPGRLATILILNKIDKLEDKAALLALTQSISERQSFDQIFMVSAESGDGLDVLSRYLAETVPQGPWHYPEDDVSDLPMRLLAAEVMREKINDRLHQELPYAITVETTDWRDMGKRGVRIEQTIYVQRTSQRAIVLGAKGQTMKAMATDARLEIADMIERPVHLFTFVKVRENWSDDPERYREMGLQFPTD
ncbi:MAG: GTPase Era [Pseudomonadota bacterium]